MPQISTAKIVELTARRGWSQARLARVADIDIDTVGHIFAAAKRGEAARRCAVDTAELLATALGVDLTAVLCDGSGRPLSGAASTVIGSWLVKSQGESLKTANGLLWVECELVHSQDDERARGKMYDLHNPPTRDQGAIQACLKRHRLVCKRVGKHPNIALNLDIVPDPGDKKRWWVIDEWVSATRLSDLLRRGALSPAQLPVVMRGIANGLAALHAVDVIRRDLVPRSILITERTAVLTDFELAKLPASMPTVAINAEWPDDTYRAPEVSGTTDVSPSCDLFSWAMILAHASSGRAPKTLRDAKTSFQTGSVPKRVAVFADKCLGPQDSRPRGVPELLAVLRTWS